MFNLKKALICVLCIVTLVLSVCAFSGCKLFLGETEITFVADGKEYHKSSGKSGEAVSMPEDPVKNGYSFDGWYLDDGIFSEPFCADTFAKEKGDVNKTVYAKFTKLTYNITYNAIGGTHKNPLTYTVTDEFTLTAAEHSDYNFCGWYLDNEFKTKVESVEMGSFGDITLYAKYDIAGFTVDYNKILSVDGSSDGVAALGATAKDRLGNPLQVSAKIKSGKYEGGSCVVYSLSVRDNAGVVSVVDTVEIPVYDVNDIDFSYFAKNSTFIKLVSHGEEFDAAAVDSFGEACEITVEFADGYTPVGGDIATIRLVATDKAGNRKVSEEICDIQIYDLPTIVLNEEALPVRENSDITQFFSAIDSFGANIPVEISVSDALVVDGTVVVTVSAIDIAGQVTTEDFEFVVFDSTKYFVKLYVDGELWDIIPIEDTENYTLPLYELSEEFDTAGWLDENDKRYTDAEGNGLVPVTESVKLYYSVIKSGYIPIFTAEDLFAMTYDGNYYLFANIDLNGAEWTPVGKTEAAFAGEFIGQGYTVSNFKLAEGLENVGFFGYFTGTVSGLNLRNVTIITTYDKYCYIGSLVGYSDHGIITDCSSSSDIIAYAGYIKIGGLVGFNHCGEITNCYSSGQACGSAVYYCFVGGLVGDSYQGNISKCYSNVIVKVTQGCDTGYVGGLVGYNNEGSVTDSYASGSVTANASRIVHAGGLAGSNSGSITRCYATGNVVAVANSGVNVLISDAGGLVGRNQYGTITDSYATGNVDSSANAKSCSSYAGGLIGFSFRGSVINSFATGNVSSLSSLEASFGGGLVGYNDNTLVTNCYRALEQMFSITKGTNNSDVPTNEEGAAIESASLKSEEWIKENLWTEGSENWVFSENYPVFAD